MEQNKGFNANLLVEHTSVSGMLYVTLDRKLLCEQQFNEHIKLELIFNQDASSIDNAYPVKKENDVVEDESMLLSSLENDSIIKCNSKEVVSLDNNAISDSPVGKIEDSIHESEENTYESEENTLDKDSFSFQSDVSLKDRRNSVKDVAKDKDIEVNLSQTVNVKRTRKYEKSLSKTCASKKTKFSVNADAISKSAVKSLSNGIYGTKSKNKTQKSSSTLIVNLKKPKSKNNCKTKSKIQIQNSSSSPMWKDKHVKSNLGDDLSCPYCMKDFISKREFWDHYRVKKKGYPCKDCGKMSTTWAHYIVHQKFSHKHDIRISSDDHGIQNCSQASLSSETNSKGLTSYKCEICNIKMDLLESLKKHMLKHTEESLYQCCICGLRFLYFGAFTSHLKLHGDVECNGKKQPWNVNVKKEFTCPHCSKKFDTEFDYDIHHEVPSVTYYCETCNEPFKSKAHLIVHTNIVHYDEVPVSLLDESEVVFHTGSGSLFVCSVETNKNVEVKNYKCNLCNFTTIDLSILSKHMMKHSGESLYKCCVCGMEEWDEITFASHLASHNDPKEVQTPLLVEDKEIIVSHCQYCTKTFNNRLEYNQHHEIETSNLTCKKCHKVFRYRGYLIAHCNIVHNIEVPSTEAYSDNQFSGILCTKETTQTGGVAFRCNVCDSIVTEMRNLSKHMMQHTHENIYKCCVCDYKTCNTTHMTAHLLKHATCNNLQIKDQTELTKNKTLSNYKHQCEFCGKLFSSKLRRNKHVNISHREENNSANDHANEAQKVIQSEETNIDNANKCPYCTQTFNNALDFKKHYKQETATFACQKCPKYFQFRGYLITHCNLDHRIEAPFSCQVASSTGNAFAGILCSKETTHKSNELYKCNVCDSNLTSKKNISRHMLQHTGESIFKCCVCDYRNNNETTFKHHLTKHCKLNNFHCKQCNLYFRNRTELSLHQSTHKHPCELCGEEFDNKTSINYHIKVAHKNDERVFKCAICDRLYTTKKAFEYHQRIHRFYKPVQCPVCGVFVKGLKRHMDSHSSREFICDKCPLKFKDIQALRRHKHSHASAEDFTFSCTQCPKKFVNSSALSRHLKIHLGEKLYVCEICGKACNRPANLRTHMRVHIKRHELSSSCRLCRSSFALPKDLQDHMTTEHANELNEMKLNELCATTY